jgi:hypothetical protein
MMAREDTSAAASAFGWANEKWGDWFHNQERGEREMGGGNRVKSLSLTLEQKVRLKQIVPGLDIWQVLNFFIYAL